jgi:hypothetical protein
MKSFRSYLTKLDRIKQSPINFRALVATTFVTGSQFLAMIPASANPVPTPSAPIPIVPTRVILNGSFEQPTVTNFVSGPTVDGILTAGQSATGAATTDIAGGNIPEGYNSPILPVIWQSTESGTNGGGTYDYKNAIEVWRGKPGSGGQADLSVGDKAASPNRQYAELNGSANAALYQDVCVLPSETLKWSLEHAARIQSSANPTNIMRVSITNTSEWGIGKTPPATKLYESGDLSVNYSDGWKSANSTWTSNNTSVQPMRFAFQAIQGSDGNSTYGNFIDNVRLDLSALVDFLPTSGGNVNLASTTEGNPSVANPPYYYLSLRINGIMASTGSVKITLTGLNVGRTFKLGSVLKGNATVSGLSATKSVSGNEITLSIPKGTYDANVVSNYIHIPIDFSNTTKQSNDSLVFTMSSPTGGGISGGVADLSIGSTSCLGTPRTIVNTLLKDDDYELKV